MRRGKHEQHYLLTEKMIDFEKALSKLDLALFAQISSQSTDDDKRSLLACQAAVRDLVPEYKYLEIGSYLGGSIQPHLLDNQCQRIYSIDKRPPSQPDARGYDWVYLNNSTKRMLEMLSKVSAKTEKITTLDADTRTINPGVIADKIHLCFIDGEHTDESVVTDFKFCLRILADRGAIVFHDAQITYNGIAACLRHLEAGGVLFKAYILPDVVFVIEIGGFPLHQNPKVLERLIDNHKAYLFSLKDNDSYRRFANRFPFGALRRLKLKLRGGNINQ